MATDWVVNEHTYGNGVLLSAEDVLWLPLTFEQQNTQPETVADTEPWAHFSPAPMYTTAVRGTIVCWADQAFSETSNQTGLLIARIVRNRMDPLTQEPGLPASSFYLLDSPLDANDDYLWQDMSTFINVATWLDRSNAASNVQNIKVEVKVGRRLDPPEQLWLVLHYAQYEATDAPRCACIPFLRTLVSDGKRS